MLPACTHIDYSLAGLWHVGDDAIGEDQQYEVVIAVLVRGGNSVMHTHNTTGVMTLSLSDYAVWTPCPTQYIPLTLDT